MNGKARTEIACSLSWFRNWNEEQRNEFANLLVMKEKGGDENPETQSLDNLMSTMTQLSLNQAAKEGPTIFECQLKIFSKWYECWNPADRSEFAVELNAIAPEFISDVNAKLGC